MPITKKQLENLGFHQINNSMFRRGKSTLQNISTGTGGNIIDNILSTQKGFRLCYDGKHIDNVFLLDRLKHHIAKQDRFERNQKKAYRKAITKYYAVNLLLWSKKR